MQIKTKNFWKILIVFLSIGWGVLGFGSIGRAVDMVDCGFKIECDKAKGETCAYNENATGMKEKPESTAAIVVQAYCRAPDPQTNVCVVSTSDPDCKKCDDWAIGVVIADGKGALKDSANFALLKEYYKATDPSEWTKERQLYFGKDIGCKSPGFCVDTGRRVAITKDPDPNNISSNKAIYECATAANACGEGNGVYEKGGQYLPQVCLDPKKPCTPKIERDLPAFVVVKDIYVNQQLFISAGAKAYCASPRNDIDPASCFMEKDATNTADYYINKIYSPDQQQLLIDNIKPLYDCKAGSLLNKVVWGIFNNSIGMVVSAVFGIIVTVVCAVLQALLFIIFAFLDWVINFSQIDFGIVDLVWRFFRDFSNMFFIVVLLYIAFCTVLGIQERSLKKMLPGFFAGVVLINFSKVLCGVAIDFSQLLSNIFLNLNPEKVAPIKALFGAVGFGGLFGVTKLFGSTDFTTLATVLGAQILMILYMLSGVIVYGATALLLAVRIVILLLMTAISPLIYLAMAVGQKKIVSSFWNTFLRTAFFAPVMIFCITLSVIVLSADLDTYFTSKAKTAKTLETLLPESAVLKQLPAEGASPQVFMKLLFAVAFMMAGLYVANKASIMGSKGILDGAGKLQKLGSEWLTMGKPAAAGAKALGKYGWGKALESRAGKYLKVLSPKVWKGAVEARRKRREKEIYGKRITELQPRLAGWRAFWGDKESPGYKREQLYALGAERAATKEVASSLNASDVQTEALYTRLDELLKEMDGKGWLGSDQALTAEVQGLLEVILSRGDINDLLKGSEYARKFSGGKAVMGADTAVLRRLFGDSERASMFANSIGEFLKQTYPQFSYATTFDDSKSLNTAEEDEDLQKIELAKGEKATGRVTFLEKTAVFQKYLRKKAEKLKAEGVDTSFEKLSNLMLDNFGYTKKEILNRKDDKGNFLIADEKLREGVATVVDTYNQNRTRIIGSEQAKRGTYQKRAHPGSFLRDMSTSDMSEEDQIKYANAPSGAKYLGVTPSSRGQLEPLSDEDVDGSRGWLTPRLIESLRYVENQKDLLAITDEMEEEAKRLRERGQEGAAKARSDKAKDVRRILKRLFDKVGQTGGEEGPIAGVGDRRGKGRDEEVEGPSSRLVMSSKSGTVYTPEQMAAQRGQGAPTPAETLSQDDEQHILEDGK